MTHSNTHAHLIVETAPSLEFETEMNGIHVNGIDMIEWDENGLITEFKVMIRPLKAVNMVHAEMGKMLEAMKGSQPS